MGTHAALAAKREKRNAYMRGWAAKNPGKNRAYSQRAKKARPWASNFSERKKGAARRGILFTLTVEDLARVWTGKCAITGLPFDLRCRLRGKAGPRPFSPSVDRIAPEKGYVPGNVRFILHCVNAFRGQMTDQLMRRVAERICSHE